LSRPYISSFAIKIIYIHYGHSISYIYQLNLQLIYTYNILFLNL